MAQRSVSSFKSTKNTRFADNTAGDIGADDSRNTFEDVADSFLNITDHLLDEDDMASDSATKVPSQQSVKAYVDAGGAVGLQSITVDISSAEILALNTTPKELIAAPGAGKYIQVLHAYIFHNYGGTAYSNETTELAYDTGRTIFTPITNFLNVSSDSLYSIPAPQNSAAGFTQFENAAVQYHATSADPTTGNGTISINLIYRIVTL